MMSNVNHMFNKIWTSMCQTMADTWRGIRQRINNPDQARPASGSTKFSKPKQIAKRRKANKLASKVRRSK